MKLELRLNEITIKESGANLQKSIEMVGGKLSLTNQRLVFKSHNASIQTDLTEIQLTDIASLEKCWIKLLGIIPIMPNLLDVNTKDGKKFSFVLFDRNHWRSAIWSQKTAVTRVEHGQLMQGRAC